MAEKKNLIYLLADSVRPDYLGCYGSGCVHTGVLDDLAARGVLFENVVSSAPWTIPSVGTHLTGLYPHRLRLFSGELEVQEEVETLFERAKGAGYITAAFFDSEKHFKQWSRSVDHYARSLDILNLLEFISANKSHPFLIFNMYRGTHMPFVHKYSKGSWYKAVDETIALIKAGNVEEVQRRYRRSIELFSDWYLSAVLDRLEEEGLLERTALVVSADHGESWGERFEDKSQIDLFSLHGPLLYNDVLKVPLVLYNLGSAKSVRVAETVRSVDILPTVLEGLGLPTEARNERYSLDGVSLAGLLGGDRGRVKFPETAFACTTAYEGPVSRSVSVISKFALLDCKRALKLIWTPKANLVELYDLARDPCETLNLTRDRPDDTERLMAMLRVEISRSLDQDEVEEEQAIRDRLRDLGYL